RAQFAVLRVRRDADDLVRLGVAVEPDTAPDRAPALEVVARHRFVHDRHARMSLVVEREIASCEEWRTERFEVLRTYPVQRDEQTRSHVLAEGLDGNGVRGPGTRRGGYSADGCGPDSGNGVEATQQLAIRLRELLPAESAAARIERNEQHGLALESEIRASELRQVANEQD